MMTKSANWHGFGTNTKHSQIDFSVTRGHILRSAWTRLLGLPVQPESQLEIVNISTPRAIVESRWDSEKYTNDSFLGNRQRDEGPRISTSILMDINNL